MKIVLTGGGTMGSVIPLLAVVEELKNRHPGLEYYWIGTRKGPEKAVVRNYNIEFKAIYTGKWRRYFSWQNLADIFKILAGFAQAIMILIKEQPDIIVSAGGFVAVPVVWAGWLLGIPSLIHQQDVRPGLANKLCAAAAKRVTVCFESSIKYFKKSKTQIVGNPVREKFKVGLSNSQKKKIREDYNLRKDLPVVLIMGGGTGSLALNKLTLASLNKLTKFCQVIHLSGGRLNLSSEKFLDIENYQPYEFLVDDSFILQLADVVVSRAGMGSLTELAYLAKPSIIIPIPNSHQEDNADYFYQREAVIKLEQINLTPAEFVKEINKLLTRPQLARQLGKRMHQSMLWDAEKKIAEIIEEIGKN